MRIEKKDNRLENINITPAVKRWGFLIERIFMNNNDDNNNRCVGLVEVWKGLYRY